MIRFGLLVLLLGSLAASAAQALDRPRVGPADSRVKVVDYDPWAVVRLTGVFRTATEIVLADDETITRVALGDSTGWEVAAEQNILFVKPKAPRAPTNLILTTRRAGETRSYIFELGARGGAATRLTRDAVFVLRFRYPQDAQRQAKAGRLAAEQGLQRTALGLKLERAILEGPRNLAYAAQGAEVLQPSEITDNGRFTVLRFPANQPLPAMFEVTAAGAESVVPFDVRGEFVVVHAVMRQMRLRRGHEVLCLYNQAFDPYGRTSDSGAASDEVERTEAGVQP